MDPFNNTSSTSSAQPPSLIKMRPKSVLSGHKGPVIAVTYSAGQGQYVLTSSVDRQIRLFNPSHGPNPDPIQTYNPATPTTLSLAVSHGSSHFLSSGANDRSVLLWDVESGTVVRRFGGHLGRVNAVSFGGATTTPPNSALLLDPVDSHFRRTNHPTSISGHGAGASSFSSSSHSPSTNTTATTSSAGNSGLNRDSVAVSGGQDRTVRVWDLRTGSSSGRYDRHRDTTTTTQHHHRHGGGSSFSNQAVMTFSEAGDAISDISVTGSEIFASSYDGRVRIYDVRMGTITTDVIGSDPVTCVVPTRRRNGNNSYNNTNNNGNGDDDGGGGTDEVAGPYLVASPSPKSCFPSVQLMERENGKLVQAYKTLGQTDSSSSSAHPSGGLDFTTTSTSTSTSTGAAATGAAAAAIDDIRIRAAFGPTEGHVLSSAGDGHVFIWELVSGAVIAKVRHATATATATAATATGMATPTNVHVTDVAVRPGGGSPPTGDPFASKSYGWAADWEWCSAGSDGNVVCWTLDC